MIINAHIEHNFFRMKNLQYMDGDKIEPGTLQGAIQWGKEGESDGELKRTKRDIILTKFEKKEEEM